MTTRKPRRFLSPKRKREPSESDFYSPSASPTSTVSVASLHEAIIRDEVESGRQSPRAAVAGRFKDLAIRGDRGPDRRGSSCDFQQPDALQAEKELCLPGRHGLGSGNSVEPSQALSGEMSAVQNYRMGCTNSATHNVPADVLVTPISTPSKKGSTASPHKQNDAISPSKSRKQRFSSPPSSVPVDDPFTWHDHEITGHNPTDPNDDGYGINGIGFKPTAAIAWARSQKRQRQVAEWKTREAREAREKRRERRSETSGVDKLRRIQEGAIQKRVKFDVKDRP